MSYRVGLHWILPVELIAPSSELLEGSGILFNPKGGNSVLRRVGGKIRVHSSPLVLEPTTVFHQSLSQIRTSQNFTGKKFPYTIDQFFEDADVRMNINFHLFGSVLCVIVSLDDFEVSSLVDFSKLQRLENHPRIRVLLLKILSVAMTGNRGASPLSSLPRYYPAIRIQSFFEDCIDWQARMVELLTRHPMPNHDVVSRVLGKNSLHQVDRSLLLVDKQGIVSYVPFDAIPTGPGNLQRFGNAIAMVELAAVFGIQLAKGHDLPDDVRKVISSPADAIPGSVSSQNTWNLISKEFQLSVDLEKMYPVEVKKPSLRVLLVTVTSVESLAVLDAFQKATGVESETVYLKGHAYQFLGALGGLEIYLAISEMGAGGLTGSQEMVRKAIHAVEPSTVIMVGIAFGIDDDEFSIGDILVSKQLMLYELQRVSKDGSITLRGDKTSASAAPLSWVRHAALKWSKSKVVPGLVLSGEKLIDNADFKENLKVLAGDAIGGEMEGAGLYAACATEGVDWILIKAICDWADGNKSVDKDLNQRLAANNAAEFSAHVLKSLRI
jgi:nucleoside phosphorylase